MNDVILEMHNITKTFPGVKALDNVNFKVKRGEIHCLVGENGADSTDLEAVDLKIYLRVEPTTGWSVKRSVSHVYESAAGQDRLVWHRDRLNRLCQQAPSRLVSPQQQSEYRDLLSRLLRRGVRRIEQVRHALLDQA